MWKELAATGQWTSPRDSSTTDAAEGGRAAPGEVERGGQGPETAAEPPAQAAGSGSAAPSIAGSYATSPAEAGTAARVDAGAGGAPPQVPNSAARSFDREFADWPMPDAAPGSRTAPSYSADTTTVRDNVTQLVWQRDVGMASDLDAAKAYCAALDLPEAGRGSWRVPTRIELVSIVDETRWDPAFDTDAFGGDFTGLFWTASVNPYGAGIHWFVDFRDGSSNAADKGITLVRCVR